MAIYPLSWVNMALHGLACPCTGLCCQGYMADQCLCWSKQWVRLCSPFWLHSKLSSWDWNVTGLSGLCSWAWNEVTWPPCIVQVTWWPCIENYECCASEFELEISITSANHVIFACWESKHRLSEFELEISRVPDRIISSTLLRKNSRNLR